MFHFHVVPTLHGSLRPSFYDSIILIDWRFRIWLLRDFIYSNHAKCCLYKISPIYDCVSMGVSNWFRATRILSFICLLFMWWNRWCVHCREIVRHRLSLTISSIWFEAHLPLLCRESQQQWSCSIDPLRQYAIIFSVHGIVAHHEGTGLSTQNWEYN